MKIVVWLNVIGLIVSLYLLALDFGQAVSSSSSFCEISSGKLLFICLLHF